MKKILSENVEGAYEKELAFINYDNPLWAKVKVVIGECEYIGRRRTGTLLKTREVVKHGKVGRRKSNATLLLKLLENVI